jgi:hypothetical protein
MSTPTTLTITIAKQKVDIEAEYRALIAGMTTRYASIDSYILLGQTYSKAQLVAKFQARIDGSEATKGARANLHTKVAEEKAVDKEVRPLRAAMKSFIQTREGKQSPQLQAFGFPESKAPKTKPAVKAEAVLKSKATRQARGTKGRKQKAGIKGAPPAQPTTAATPPAGVASPATSGVPAKS